MGENRVIFQDLPEVRLLLQQHLKCQKGNKQRNQSKTQQNLTR